jgi:hypothetical protein
MLTMQSRAYSRTALPLTGTARIILTKKVVALWAMAAEYIHLRALRSKGTSSHPSCPKPGLPRNPDWKAVLFKTTSNTSGAKALDFSSMIFRKA